MYIDFGYGSMKIELSEVLEFAKQIEALTKSGKLKKALKDFIGEACSQMRTI